MADELPLWFRPISSDDSSDSSILFLQNLIEDAELQDTGTSNRRRYIERQREVGHETLMADYFVEDLKYNEDIFRHRFRMSKRLFLKIVSDVEENDSWFQEALDVRGRKGFTSLQKVTSAIKQLATGNTPDENDEYLHMAERTFRECLEYFCDTVCKIYAPEFLRRPTSHDMALLYKAHEEKHHLPDDGNAIAPVHIRDPPVEPVIDDTVLGELMDKDTHWRLKHDLINHLASQDLPHLLVDSDKD
ncbi:uncharacterized protein LOC110942457 [Helianthus annuus]|uniref:uncharacterized protein LOC110942457 n=1 Tax=Helianthus annuus TaxID=4232 RepID=UPI000B8F2FB8|nr:uncharacterized protein LOC110942457 [Helianthus annuus]